MGPTRLPRVLFVSPVSDFKGGAEVVLRNMLVNPHIEPVLAVPEEGPLADAAAAMGVSVCFYRSTAMMKVHRPPRPGPVLAAVFDAVRCARRIRRLATVHGCDLLHSNGLKSHILCALLGTITASRTLVHLHDIPYNSIERLIWRLIARQVDQVIMVSRPCFPGHALPTNVAVLHNGIRPVHETLPPQRQPGPLRLGFVGRFHPNKGLDLLIDWFKSVRDAGIDATLTIRGRPDPVIPTYWDGIKVRLHDMGLAPWVLVEGWTTGAATYADIDVLLITSNIPDPSPLVVAEAMSAGVIVAGYPAGGIPDLIHDNRNGLIVRDGDDLVRKLRVLCRDPTAFERLRALAFAEIEASFGLSRFHAQLRDVYLTLMKKPV